MTSPRPLARLRGEARRIAHPLSFVGTASVAAMASYMQTGRPPYARAPSPADAFGALRIGLLQHATLLGAALAALLAGVSTGDDLRSGTVDIWRFSDPRVRLRWARRIGTIVAFLLGSTLLTAAALRVGFGADSSRRASSAADLVLTAGPALVVMTGLATATLVASVFVRDPVVLVLATVTVLTLPSRLGGAYAHWLLPSGWLGTSLFLTEEGTSIDYLAQKTYAVERLPSQAIGSTIVAVMTVVLFLVGARAGHRATGSDDG